ncbi:PEP-CTERM sorting domain-containing protein [Gemmatimonas sp.]|uniref:PEP-CTERM sorting domain-containing protein n=1 Tax=Gemmatimonas sp. TaxID=1962908 RepID=UPI0035658B6A
MFNTTLHAGSTIQFAFGGAWDSQTINSGANWTIASISTSGVTTVPEPSTYIVMAAGLGALAVAARRNRPLA